MQPTQKAGEPSMEEILASIRKIISEDPSAPAPAKPPATPGSPTLPVSTAATLARAAAPGIAQPPKPAERPAPMSLEKELADLLREPVELPPAARNPVPPAARAVPPATPSMPTAAPAKEPELPSGLTAWFRGKTPGSPAAPTPLSQLPAAPDAALPHLDIAAKEGLAEDVPETPSVVPVRDAPQELPAAADLKAGSEARKVESQPVLNGTPVVPSSMQAILGRLNSVSATSPGPLAPSPPKARPFPPADAKPSGDGPSIALSLGAGPPATPKGSEPVVSPSLPAVPAEVSAPVPAALASTPPVSKSNAPVVEDEQSAIAATAEAIAASAPAAIAAATAAAASLPGKDTSALEDTLSDLLRPMVRQWLDEHMRGALEKALREEIASKKAKPAG